MNKIKRINQINQKELASSATSYKSSWHYEYRDTNYIFISNIPNFIKPHDLVVIFSQYGIPTHLNLIKNHETGQHRGFAFLKYANFKSCVLAIDNFNGIKVGDRMLHVDHSYYKLRRGEKEDDFLINYDEVRKELEASEDDKKKKEEKEEKDLKLIESGEAKPKAIALEFKSENKEKKEEVKGDDDNEFVDPMQTIAENATNEAQVENEDDEFVDPMQQFITETTHETKEKSHKSHRTSRHRSHRSHRVREKSLSLKNDRDRSPTREEKKEEGH